MLEVICTFEYDFRGVTKMTTGRPYLTLFDYELIQSRERDRSYTTDVECDEYLIKSLLGSRQERLTFGDAACKVGVPHFGTSSKGKNSIF